MSAHVLLELLNFERVGERDICEACRASYPFLQRVLFNRELY